MKFPASTRFALACALLSAVPAFAGDAELVPTVPPELAQRARPTKITLEARNVMSVIGDSLVYSLGNQIIVITSGDEAYRTFLTQVKEKRLDAKMTLTLVPEQKSLYNARFKAFHLNHPPLMPPRR